MLCQNSPHVYISYFLYVPLYHCSVSVCDSLNVCVCKSIFYYQPLFVLYVWDIVKCKHTHIYIPVNIAMALFLDFLCRRGKVCSKPEIPVIKETNQHILQGMFLRRSLPLLINLPGYREWFYTCLCVKLISQLLSQQFIFPGVALLLSHQATFARHK